MVGWRPVRDGGDSAALRLTTPAPQGVRPARLTPTDTRWGDQVRVLGEANFKITVEWPAPANTVAEDPPSEAVEPPG